MYQVSVTREFPVSADVLWQLTGDFGGLRAWLPGVVSCEVTGEGAADNGGDAVRSVALMDGSVTRERLESLDPTARRCVYSIMEAKGFDGSSAFVASFHVLPREGKGCEVQWSAQFTLPSSVTADKAPRAVARVEQMYAFFLEHLQRQVGAG